MKSKSSTKVFFVNLSINVELFFIYHVFIYQYIAILFIINNYRHVTVVNAIVILPLISGES
jgi:hypothetical protein